MKKDWTYKSFEDCIEKVKYTTKLQSKDYLANGDYPIVSQEEELISGYWNNAADVFHAERPLVVFGDHTRVLKYVDFDFVLGADGVKILLPIEDLRAKFLYYYLKWYNVPNLGYSRHYKLLKDITLPIPPISIQESIVRELDAIHGILEKKQAQLRELDNLAQAIFYEMFGDPVTNPKQWEVKKLGEVGCVITGNTPSTKDVENYSSNDVCFFKPSDLETTSINLLNKSEYYISKYAYKKARQLPKDTVLTTCIGIIGKVGILAQDSTCNQQINAIIPNKDTVLSRYLASSIFNLRYLLQEIANAPIVPLLNKTQFSNFSIPLPPLSLQQSFAAKIEAIEAQKQAITQSIHHTEALLAQRMDQYFA